MIILRLIGENMPGIMTALSAASKIIEVIAGSNSNMTEKEIADAIKKTATKTSLIMTDGSITKLVSQTLVEPVAIVTKDLKQEDIIQKVLELNTDIFAGFYMQAYEILKNLHGVPNRTIVNILGTDNSSIGKVMTDTVLGYLPKLSTLSHESFDFCDDLFKEGKFSLSIEDAKDDKINAYDDELKKLKQELELAKQPTPDGKHSTELKANENLYATLVRNIELVMDTKHTTVHGEKSHKIILPITIKTHIIFTDIDSVLRMLAPNNHNKSFSYRLDEYRSGAIGMSDLLFAGDLIKEYKDNKLKDKDGLIALLQQRTLSANTKMVSGGVAGFEKFYNMFIISGADQIRLEKQLGGKLHNEAYKQRFMEQGGGLLLTVIDQDYERIVTYTKDIRGITDISFKALLKRNSKSNDFEEIVKAILTNRAPVF
jgi:hypothetical protein